MYVKYVYLLKRAKTKQKKQKNKTKQKGETLFLLVSLESKSFIKLQGNKTTNAL